MASPRDFFIKYLYPLGKLAPTSWLINSSNQRLVLPFYHAISDETIPHIENLYRVKGTKEFNTDLDFLLKYFDPVDFIRFREIAQSGSKPRKPVFLLTFDDGLREFHDVIAPILVKKGIPAVCFLNSAFIDNKDLFFKYKASVLVSHLRKQQKSSGENESQLLSIDYANKQKLDEFASQIGYDFKEYLNLVKPYLTTVQIEKLIKDGFHIGAHSIDHPEYRFLPFDEQIRQTEESVNFIKNKFSLNYSLFSFPFTDYEVSDKFFQHAIANKIFELSFGGAGLKKERYPFHFQRIAFEREKLKAKDIYKVEAIYSAMLNAVGKNVMDRV